MSIENLTETDNRYDFVIIGGGIAGTSCAQTLCDLTKTKRILLLSASPLVKAVFNKHQITKFLQTFDIEETTPSKFTTDYKNLTILERIVLELNTELKKITCFDNYVYYYNKLCICSGGSPKLICTNNDYVLGIRDTETVIHFQEKLKNSRKILIVGNGGIATELVYEIENCDIVWAIKDEHISHMYFDAHSAKFFDKRVRERKIVIDDREKESDKLVFHKKKYTVTRYDMRSLETRDNVYGTALGPDWAFNLPIKGISSNERNVNIEYKCEIKRLLSHEEYIKNYPNQTQVETQWPVYAELTNDKIYGVDFIISATGVIPSVGFTISNNTKFLLGEDGGILVNDKMETNINDIYAAGDCCTAGWNKSPYWFQMRLWSQANQMGDFAAKSMYLSSVNKEKEIQFFNFCFEVFAHITKFFNFKVILLGNYQAKDLGNDYELLIRCTEGVEYVKVVVHHGRVVGALLIGETDLEETFENLILNQIDVSQFGENLINPDIDIEDYFD